ncbi:MAG: hypothetical protein CME64_07410 [Halobacteriovoraceae bacterium]|nr:hypothetical protein [Halobacteriovoraceae bacterium]|tara:strand:- start:263 stop:976 length:714 start_codon:yes stop_codon:yes gene_type:complete
MSENFTPSYLKKRHYNWGIAAVVAALGTCAIVSMFYWEPNGELSGLIAANPENVFKGGDYWRLITSTFAHGDLEHLLSNSLMLGFLTYFVASFYGLGVLLFSFLMGSVINLATLAHYDTNTTLVGASGVVYFLWGLWLMLYVCIQKNLSVGKRLMRMGAVFLVLLVPTTYSPQTSYFAHYVGFLMGMVSGGIYYVLSPKKASKEEILAELKQEEPESEEWGDPEWEDNLISEIESKD